MINVTSDESRYSPEPKPIPTAAVTHKVAAVVNPFTENPFFKIVPAPRKPIPETICAAILPGSPPLPANTVTDNSVRKAAPTDISA